MSHNINWNLNVPGIFCYKNGNLCEHNHIDGPVREFICSGLGGKCIEGNKFEYREKEKDKWK